MKKSKILPVVIVILSIIVLGIIGISIVISDLLNDGYAYYGEWYATPEEAISKGMQGTLLEPRTILDTIYLEGETRVVYVSDADEFVLASCVSNEDGEWYCNGSTEEEDLSNPIQFVLNGDDNQMLLFTYFETMNGIGVYGFKYTDTKPLLVNGQEPETKTYTFTMGGREWSIDYWWLADIDTNNMEDVPLVYKES